MKSKLRIAVLWRPGRNTEWQSKYTNTLIPDDASEEAGLHRDALLEAGHDAFLVRWDAQNPEQVAESLRQGGVDLVFNASSLQEVALLEACDIPFCGSGTDLVALDKATRKKLLAYHDVPTAPFMVVDRASMPMRGILSLEDLRNGFAPKPPMSFPLFVKPVRGRGSSGISDDSIVHDTDQLRNQASAILERLSQGALVENYLAGREITVGIIGSPPIVLTPLEIEYNNARTNSFEHKKDNEIMHCPARVDAKTLDRVKHTALAAFEALGARDYGRVDTILTQDGTPWVLEINTFAGLQTLTGKEAHLHASYIGTMAKQMGMNRSDLIGGIAEAARKRYGL